MKEVSIIRVIGCPLGLDQASPTMPIKSCQHPCQWRIRHEPSHNCLWELTYKNSVDGNSFTLRETGDMIGVTHESVRHIEMRAMRRLKERLEFIEKGVNVEVFLRHVLSIRFTSSDIERKWRKDNGEDLNAWHTEEQLGED